MRVLLYSHFFFPSVGGVEQTTEALASFLAQNGVDVTVCTRTRNEKTDDYDFPVFRRPGLNLTRRVIAQSDIIYTMGFNLQCAALASLQAKPYVWDHPDHDLVCPKNTAWDNGDVSFDRRRCRACLARDWSPLYVAGLPVHLRLRRWYAKKAALHIFHSRYALSRAKAAAGSLTSAVIPCIPPREPIRDLNRSIGRNNFVFLGRLIPEKGCQIAIGALAEVEGATLEIIGDGWYRKQLESLAKKLGVKYKVNFRGRLPHSEVIRGLSACRALVIPSLWGEPFGQVVLQAISQGVPVIVSDAGALPEIVGGGGIIFPSGDCRALAKAMEDILADDGLARTTSIMGAQRYAAAFEPQAIGRRYLEVLQRVAQSG